VLAEFELPSRAGNERVVIDRVRAVVAPLNLGGDRLERLGTAVGEATMNAMEHGNGYRDDRPVTVRVVAEPDRLRVTITDLGGRRQAPGAEVPDLEAKLEGRQRPRGWGLFLIEHMVDETREHSDDRHHTVELSLRLGGDGHAHT
jgi:anti-sigma regulatory factor (Ser/Thr protein kinase)